METVAVFKLPASPNIVRAGCREPQIPLLFPDYKLLPREWPPIDMYNYLSNYLWQFNISLFNFFPLIFFDIRYGYVLFRDHTDALNAPDYAELTYNATEFKTNIAGTTYTKGWGNEINVSDAIAVSENVSAVLATFFSFDSQTKDGHLAKNYITAVDWDTAWTGVQGQTPLVHTSLQDAQIQFIWEYQESDPAGAGDWKVIKHRQYLSFDTSSLSGQTVVSAKLKLHVFSFGTVHQHPLSREIEIYSKAWGTLDTGDWSGGSLVGTVDETDLVEDQYNEIDLENSSVDVEGETQLKIVAKKDEDGTKPSDPAAYSPAAGTTVRVGGVWCSIYMGNHATLMPKLEVQVAA